MCGLATCVAHRNFPTPLGCPALRICSPALGRRPHGHASQFPRLDSNQQSPERPRVAMPFAYVGKLPPIRPRRREDDAAKPVPLTPIALGSRPFDAALTQLFNTPSVARIHRAPASLRRLSRLLRSLRQRSLRRTTTPTRHPRSVSSPAPLRLRVLFRALVADAGVQRHGTAALNAPACRSLFPLPPKLLGLGHKALRHGVPMNTGTDVPSDFAMVSRNALVAVVRAFSNSP